MQRNIVPLLIAFSLAFVQYGMVFPLVPLDAQELGASPAVIGLIVGAFSLLSLFRAIPIAGITDRFGVNGRDRCHAVRIPRSLLGVAAALYCEPDRVQEILPVVETLISLFRLAAFNIISNITLDSGLFAILTLEFSENPVSVGAGATVIIAPSGWEKISKISQGNRH